jgi:hypothetical protein
MGDEFPEDLFQQTYRRAPTDEDRDRLISVKASLGLSARDELWPLILVLDHHASTSAAARSATVKEVKEVLQALKSVPEQAGPIAAAEAHKAIAKAVDEAADKIAKVAVKRSQTRAELLSKSQYLVTAIMGALLAVCLVAVGATTAWRLQEGRGVCSEPATVQNGIEYCVIDRSPNE